MAKDVKIVPIGKRILVKPDGVENETAGGLILPPSATEDKKSEVGTVVKVGTGEKDFEFSVKVGDRVFFKKYSPDQLDVDGEEYYILSEEDVLAIVG